MTQPLPRPTATPIEAPAADPIKERRQRAREAGFDTYDEERDGGALFEAAIEAAIETATRVRIDPLVVSRAAFEAGIDPGALGEALPIALRLLGLEVQA
jgi:hypothetical protein